MSTDIEDILSVTKQSNSIFKDITIKTVDFVKDLCNNNFSTYSEFNNISKILRKKYHISPSKPELCMVYDGLIQTSKIKPNKHLKKFIKGKEMRSLSGVIVISILTSPYPTYTDKNGNEKTQKFSCKHDCFYCPRETDENGKEINPRSYLSDEPAVARALQSNYDTVSQFNDRACQYVINGHEVDKIELIILGGTWTEYPPEYQEKYIRDCFWAANTFYDTKKRDKLSLIEEQNINENNKLCRIIGVTLEMRPDSINIEEIKRLRYLGCTRVQLGVQHTNDNILKTINRGCYLNDTIRALKLLKDNGYKVDAHWMPDLPTSTPEIDKEMFNFILNSDKLQFDQWKIYPTATVPWTKIKKWYDEGSYIPYTEKDPNLLVNLLLDVKKRVYPWIRLNRVIRDIPNYTRDGKLYIHAGNKVTNLRQILHNKLREEHNFCKCIRCREVKKNNIMAQYSQIIVRNYNSSGGTEYFISMESGNTPKSYFNKNKWYNNNGEVESGILHGFVRLRISNNAELECLKDASLIRELHVYGQVATTKKEVQHTGVGKLLMKKAEEISYKNRYYKIAVISGIGVRKYYKKLGYELIDTFMIKKINIIYILWYELVNILIQFYSFIIFK